ncbi:putative urea amidolyase protein [Neofusicoccum parvum UCRNP2]|uniref:Putative urea amidolyase protein n=1 Tax=Botryosphaeria parva (strain UCR-NP2) TaxID=1287680 RepID=R1GTK8_BOTPV|nr:putative urea amidolyase protein [Neofusicoccum parvum UCRNP2]
MSTPGSDAIPVTARQWVAAQRQGGALQRLLAIIDSQDAHDPAWISLATPHDIQQQLAQAERLRGAGADLPLFGVPVAVKDNIDVAGMATTAACPGFAFTADGDAGVVRQLKQAGAVVVGKCNLDQFATGLVGVRSPYGAVPNTFDAAYVCGGSSSGSASVVARGIVPLALGTDTAGSGRVPAALNNLVGLKPTRGALSTHRVVPACRTLDCVSILALDLDDAALAYRVLAVFDPADPFSRPLPPPRPPPPTPRLRIAIDSAPQWYGDTAQQHAYRAALAHAAALGWQLVPVDFSDLFDVAHLLYDGPWVAERYTVVRDCIDKRLDMDPTVRDVVSRATNFSAADVFSAEYRRHALARAIEQTFAAYDALLVPTTPIFPTIAEVHAEPVAKNSLLGTYTNFVNLLDWTALAFPAGFRHDGLPFGLTLISRGWEEMRLLDIARQWLARGPRRLGATSQFANEQLPAGPAPLTADSRYTVAVVGAHLSDLPLNHQLVDIGAALLCETTTSTAYRLYELPDAGAVRKPGLVRVAQDQGSTVAVELWALPPDKLGSFAASVPFPLSIGRVELADASWVMGFLVQPDGLTNALDITAHGGWKAYLRETGCKSACAPPQTIESVLIANRGEIAVRISATLKNLGIRSIAIYSDEDQNSRHVHDADEAFPLEGRTLAETYLCGEQLIAIAKRAGADAVIPGYGMLSENASFAAACEAAGLVWIGPTPEQIRLLGLKHTARELAGKAQVPLLPGSGLVRDAASAVVEAKRIGFPVILKSTGGGGGVGLEQCSSAEEVETAFDSVRRLGKTFFADEGVFVEKFVQNARHIEVQIIGDGSGNVRHISERDCSLQRRHQKVVEESPALLVPDSVRAQMRSAAIRFASAVSYRNVGTIEFLYDPDTTHFYFLEANTRLQVEHPVTEAVTDLDLVEMMVSVARGQASDLFNGESDGFDPRGVALEARIYAECPLQNFRPSPGVLLDVDFPDDIRVDTWVGKGTQVSASFDPLLAKIIVHAETRPLAIEKLCNALDRTRIHGVETNVEYLRHEGWDIGMSGYHPQGLWTAMDFVSQTESTSGGKAGLHPSNIHDGPYSIGTISFTGDDAVILTCDGPSLGGFVCFATVITADLWKLGQMKPGDRIQLRPVSITQALQAEGELSESVQSLSRLQSDYTSSKLSEPIILDIGSGEDRRVYRQAGDAALLVELGTGEFNIRCSLRLFSILKRHRDQFLIGVHEITAGVRSLHVQYTSDLFTPQEIVATIEKHCSSPSWSSSDSATIPYGLPTQIPSRIIHLPIAFDHPTTLAATDRYTRTVRASAPYLPSNTEFLRRLNGLPSAAALRAVITAADFLVLGLGDVFCGSPCAIPLDPRHRLAGAKYAPPRSFTPEGTVGLGGQYLCVYAVDGPGGYQMVGRTVRAWTAGGQEEPRPWRFELFDRVRFHEVEPAALDAARAAGPAAEERLVRVEDRALLDVAAYESWLAAIADDVETVVAERERRALQVLGSAGDACWKEGGAAEGVAAAADDARSVEEDGLVAVESPVTGKCWKWGVEEGSAVAAGHAIICVESMKMEMKAGEVVAYIKPSSV